MATAAQKRAEKAAADQKAADELAAAETAAAEAKAAEDAAAVAAAEPAPEAVAPEVTDETVAPVEGEDTAPAEEAGAEPVGLTEEEAAALAQAAADSIAADVAEVAEKLAEVLEDVADEAPVEDVEVNPEAPQAQAAAIAGVGIASAPLDAPEARKVENQSVQHSDPNIPEGSNAVIAARVDRPEANELAAEDGDPIDLDTLWLGPDVAGLFTSTVRIVEHSEIPPYGHKTTLLVVGAGVPVDQHTRSVIDARLRAQAAASA